MITKRDDYVYVTGDIHERDEHGRHYVAIDGGIMTRREKPDVLRGEDICFLKECVCSRFAEVGVDRPAQLAEFSRLLNRRQILDLVSNYNSLTSYDWINRNAYVDIPDCISKSDLGIRTMSMTSCFNAMNMLDRIATIDTPLTSLQNAPILDMLNKIPRMSMRMQPIGSAETRPGVRSNWRFPFTGQVVPIGIMPSPPSIGSFFKLASGYGNVDEQEAYREGFSFEAEGITRDSESYSAFNFFIVANGLIDHVDTYFIVDTYYLRNETVDGHDLPQDMYTDSHMLKGPTVDNISQFVEIPVTDLVTLWKTHVLPLHNFDITLPTVPSAEHRVVSFALTCNLTEVGFVIALKDKICVV